MTDEVYEYRKRVKRSSMYWGIIIGLNTAVLYLQEVLERPDTVELFLKMAQEIREAMENEYSVAKADEKEYAVQNGFIKENEDAEQQGQGEEV